jgi:hypothetical protein
MAGRDGKKQARKANAGRRLLVGVGAGAGAFLAAAAMATGSAVTAAPAHADFEDLLDPIIQPLLTSFTDSISAIDPAAAVDLTSWTDSLLASLNTSFDVALPSTDTAAAAAASGAEPAAAATYDLPITIQEATEPTVQAAVDGGSSLPVLVDTGSSGLVVPLTDLGSSTQQLTDLFDLGFPTSFGESGYSGGVDFLYLTYNDVPVSYADGLTTGGPVEIEVYSWDPSDFSSFFTNDAFQTFLGENDSAGGILGIGDNVSGGAGTSPFDSYGSALVDLKNTAGGDLVIGGSNPYGVLDTFSGNGSTASGLTETVTSSTGTTTGVVDDDLDSGGVYGTIPSSISPSALTPGDVVTVLNNGKELYQYTVGTDLVAGKDVVQAPMVISESSIDSGVEPFLTHALYIDYANDATSIDATH